MTGEPTWTDLASRQHGAVSRAQLQGAGATRKAIRHAVQRGRLLPLSPRVLAVRGSPDTAMRRAMAAVLDSGEGVIALWSAPGLLGVPGWTLEPLHVLTSRRPHRGSPHLGIIHSSVRLGPSDICVVDGIPVTTPVRTLTDLAARLHPGKVADLCDDLLRRRMMTVTQLHAAVAELPPQGGRGGTRVMRALAAARPEGYRPTDSKLERRFEEILERAGDAPFERQVDLGDEQGWVGRVDFADRRRRVAVEIQSETFHSSLTDRRRDAARLARLRAAGWTVVEVIEHDVFHRPDLVLRRIRAARAGAEGNVA